MRLSDVSLLQLKKSPNAWISYALDTDKLIEGEVNESRLKISSFEQEIEKEICSVKLHIDGVDIGNDATVENLLRVFAIEGAPELDSNLFSVTNVVLTSAQLCEGSVEFVFTTKKKDSFFFRARMRDDSNDIGKNKFEKKRDKVQLWEGGPYWATTNIGAENPEDYGYYFWWGDTVGYKWENDMWIASDGSNFNFSFESSNTPTCDKDGTTLKSEGWTISSRVLAPEHDAAQAHWGGDWRMPTEQEFENLCSMCDWTLTIQNGIKGYIIKGRDAYASSSIFLPCAGLGEESFLDYVSSGYYWSSSVSFWDLENASSLCFDSSSHYMYGDRRYFGLPVRPLQRFTK